jgi:hypothetical protein
MATSKNEQTQILQYQLPIVATNLRALVSSWLPPARDPSPMEDDVQTNGDIEGRQERYIYICNTLTEQTSPWSNAHCITTLNASAKSHGSKNGNFFTTKWNSKTQF